MRKKFCAVLLLSLTLICQVNAKGSLLLKCDYKLFYIDKDRKLVGYTFYDNETKKYNIYNWYYKNAKFDKHLITFYDPSSALLGYYPKIAHLNKWIIDRRVPSATLYYKDEGDLHSIIKKLPLDLILQASRFLDWKSTKTDKCEMFKSPSNAKFVSKKEWDNIQKEILRKENTNKF